jgi:hypothetical protein
MHNWVKVTHAGPGSARPGRVRRASACDIDRQRNKGDRLPQAETKRAARTCAHRHAHQLASTSLLVVLHTSGTFGEGTSTRAVAPWEGPPFDPTSLPDARGNRSSAARSALHHIMVALLPLLLPFAAPIRQACSWTKRALMHCGGCGALLVAPADLLRVRPPRRGRPGGVPLPLHRHHKGVCSECHPG